MYKILFLLNTMILLQADSIGDKLKTCLNANDAEFCIIDTYLDQTSQLSAEQKEILRLAKRLGRMARNEHDGANPQQTTDVEEASTNLRLALKLRVLQILQERSLSTTSDLSKLSAEQLSVIFQSLKNNLNSLVANKAESRSQAQSFSNYCDSRVASVFGPDGAVAAASGYDKGLLPTARGEYMHRFHLFSSAHIYSDVSGSKKTAPLYAPNGWTSYSKGGDTVNASYVLSYPQLGSLKNVNLNVVHLGESKLTSRPEASAPKNAMGSVLIGTSGGPGGTDSAPGKTNYAHSHLQIFSQDGRYRYSFSEAFCSSVEIFSAPIQSAPQAPNTSVNSEPQRPMFE